MLRNVLIVDDDRILRNLIAKKCAKYKTRFTPLLAGDGIEALDILKEKSISLIITDLQMPNMDGFELIAHLTESYPDIPVIILTGYKAPTWKKQILQKDASGYIEKPFVVEDLVETIRDSIEKEAEGGLLHTVSLEMFVQLIDIDSRTCTIRVVEKATQREGGLFFKDGILMDARIGEVRGKKAACDILTWNDVVLLLQDSCPIKERMITADLRAILMDAMNLRDPAEKA